MSQFDVEESKVRSFRLNSEVDRQLLQVAEEEGLTPSGFLNQIVNLYVEYTRYAKQINSITISETSIKGFLNYVTEDECRENGVNLGLQVPPQLFMMSGTPISIEKLGISMNHLGDHSRWFTPTFHGRGKNGYWFIQNSLGTKWRCFLEGYFTGLIRSLGAESDIEILGDNLIVRVKGTQTNQTR